MHLCSNFGVYSKGKNKGRIALSCNELGIIMAINLSTGYNIGILYCILAYWYKDAETSFIVISVASVDAHEVVVFSLLLYILKSISLSSHTRRMYVVIPCYTQYRPV